MGIFENPDTWGSSAWIFLYCIVNTFPENPSTIEKIHYEKFFNDLKNVLPCTICRKHYKKWLVLMPIDKYLKSKESLKEWLFLLHNFVNLRLDKKFIPIKMADDIMKEHIKTICNKH